MFFYLSPKPKKRDNGMASSKKIGYVTGVKLCVAIKPDFLCKDFTKPRNHRQTKKIVVVEMKMDYYIRA